MGRNGRIQSGDKAIRKRSLRFESLDTRLVLSANMVTHEAPQDIATAFGDQAMIDIAGDRTTFRNLEVGYYAGTPEVAARSFLSEYADVLGLPENVSQSLEVIDAKYGLASSHAYFQQTFRGLPVVGAQVTVSMNSSGAVQTVHTSFREHRGTVVGQSRIGAEQAIQSAHEYGGVETTWMDGRIESVWVIQKGGTLEPAWEMMVHAETPIHQELLTIVSAVDGRVISQEDRSTHATGSGLVYDPNPFQTQGSSAGMVDNNDNTNATLDAERINVTLERLDDGTGLLRGEWVDLTLPGGLNVPDANEPTRIYNYDRNDPRFEQVVVYYAVDQMQAYFHSLGFDDDAGPTANGIRDFPTMAHAHWFTADNSFYSTGNDAIHFGDGGVDDAEDADIIAHEYGHAVQHDQNPNWGGGEMGAMGEGFGDYLAASFYADVGDATFQSQHAAAVGEWDAVSYSSANPPNLRRVDGNKMYPGDLVGQVHADGEIWSAALWDIRGDLGGPATDTLVLESHFGLPGGASMVDARNAIIQADANLNGGANQSILEMHFDNRGIMFVPDDHGNTAATATPFPVNSEIIASIENFGDVDYFSFGVPQGADVVIETRLISNPDTTLTLYGTNGVTQLDFDDDGGAGLASRIAWTVPADGTYYAAVRGFSNARTGTYGLEITSTAVLANGDFNADGNWDCDDIDELVGQVASGSSDGTYDMNADGMVDRDDISEWLAVAGATNLASGNAYLDGDANLDGFVDGSDFNLWNNNKFTQTAEWCSGDFNADGFIDSSDFNIWNNNKFLSSAVLMANTEQVEVAAVVASRGPEIRLDTPQEQSPVLSPRQIAWQQESLRETRESQSRRDANTSPTIAERVFAAFAEEKDALKF